MPIHMNVEGTTSLVMLSDMQNDLFDPGVLFKLEPKAM